MVCRYPAELDADECQLQHAKKCHGESTIAGEGSHHLLDDYHALVLQRKIEHGAVDAT